MNNIYYLCVDMMRKRNPIAKYMNVFNKPKTHKNKKKENKSSRKTKHKKSFHQEGELDGVPN